MGDETMGDEDEATGDEGTGDEGTGGTVGGFGARAMCSASSFARLLM